MEGAVHQTLPEGFQLIETFAWRRNPGFLNLPEHLARMERSARVFGIPFERAAIDAALARVRAEHPLRVRLTLGVDGVPEVSATVIGFGPETWNIGVSDSRLDPADPWLRVKTTQRALYDTARASLPRDLHELVFLNTRGEVCEGTIFNVFVKIDDVFLTPRLSCGLLPGVFRQIMLRQGRAREAVLRIADLRRGQVFLGNSLRGLCVARLIE